MNNELNNEDIAFLITTLEEFILTTCPSIPQYRKLEFNKIAIELIEKFKNKIQILTAPELQVLSIALLDLKYTIEETYPVFHLESREYLNNINYYLSIFNISDY
ncbi:hypothetical protein LI064_02850 [Clostridium perfringens]|uniref:hypothetical protein n=1 Tax=Clostridium perfringens TaxID=1502 RepID=UPI0022450EDA|nr:hypothetical protein [Clostridium perfringens]MCX0353461.1 hypothetical protein [Clostridium perfringens]